MMTQHIICESVLDDLDVQKNINMDSLIDSEPDVLSPDSYETCFIYQYRDDNEDRVRTYDMIMYIMEKLANEYDVIKNSSREIIICYNCRQQRWLPVLMMTQLPGAIYNASVTYDDGNVCYNVESLLKGYVDSTIFDHSYDYDKMLRNMHHMLQKLFKPYPRKMRNDVNRYC